MGQCKFNEKWFEEDTFRGWLEKAGDYEARCRLSRKAFILGTMGAKALESHMRSQKYIRYSVAASGTTPMPVLFERSGLKSSASVASTSHQTALTGFVSPPETQKAEVLRADIIPSNRTRSLVTSWLLCSQILSLRSRSPAVKTKRPILPNTGSHLS